MSSKGSFISETVDNFDHLNHHWPKIPANLNPFFARQRKNSNWLEFNGSILSKVSEIKLPLKQPSQKDLQNQIEIQQISNNYVYRISLYCFRGN